MTHNLDFPVMPRIAAPHCSLDPAYLPAVEARQAYGHLADTIGGTVPLLIALEREGGCIARGDLDVLPLAAGHRDETLRLVERHIKFLLWSRGGWRLNVAGPEDLCAQIASWYHPGGQRAFDAETMGRIYDCPFEVRRVPAEEIPPERMARLTVGGHLEGCRIGFDLGASDYKLAAVQDGETLFSTEIPWDPVRQSDPEYHRERIANGLRQAAGYLPRLDAIGGSAAGIYVNNRVKVASLFRGVPEARFATDVEPFFLQLAEQFGVPMVIANDGDVTALAGAMALRTNGILGIAMGSSEAVGYIDPEGHICGWLNELAFAPVDFNPAAAVDEWSRDHGVGALYFSQQAVNKLALAGGERFDDAMGLPERMKAVQAVAEAGDSKAEAVFRTMGCYLGYTLPHYAAYYDFSSVLLLGRAMSGRGGDIVLTEAQRVLESQFPDLAERISLRVPDERMRRVGQAVAAASLPDLG